MIYQDFSLARYEDGILQISMVPPTQIGGWTIQFECQKRFGGTSGFMTKNVASGFNGQSGIFVVDSGAGVMNVVINSVETSGLDYGNYSFGATRQDSGNITTLSIGYLMLSPSVG